MQNNSMTLKQISELTGKTERTVRRWIKTASEKTSGLSDKMSSSEKTKKPAQFTLEETIEIIRAGGNETLANLLMQNATEKSIEEKPKKEIEIFERVINILDRLDKRMSAFENKTFNHGRQEAIEKPKEIPKYKYSHLIHSEIGKYLKPQMTNRQVMNLLFRNGYYTQIIDSFGTPALTKAHNHKVVTVNKNQLNGWKPEIIEDLQNIIDNLADREDRLFA